MGSSSTASSISNGNMSNIEFEYEGPHKYCFHKFGGWKLKAVRKTLWTDDNPGRRFFGCRLYNKIPSKNKGCGYFEWYDEPMGERAKILLNLLKNGRIGCEGNKVQDDRFEVGTELGEIWEELGRLKKMHMKQREDLKKERNKVKVGYIVAVIGWIILFIVLLG